MRTVRLNIVNTFMKAPFLSRFVHPSPKGGRNITWYPIYCSTFSPSGGKYKRGLPSGGKPGISPEMEPKKQACI